MSSNPSHGIELTILVFFSVKQEFVTITCEFTKGDLLYSNKKTVEKK
jgi:hypothetical protein